MFYTAVETFGWIGTAAAIIIFIPQVIKLIRTKDASTLSRFAFGVNAFGAAMWTIFSAATAVWQGFACNAFIIVLLLVIFHYMYKEKRRYFYMWVVFVATVIAVSVVLAAVVKPKDVPIAVNYVFVIMASVALGVAFVPQIRTIFVQKDFHSYSFATSLIIAVNNMFWAVYWIGKSVMAEAGNAGDADLFPVFAIGAASAVFQIFLQLSASPFYFRNKRRQAEAASRESAG